MPESAMIRVAWSAFCDKVFMTTDTKIHEIGADAKAPDKALKLPATRPTFRNELSSWFKFATQLLEKGRQVDLCEFLNQSRGTNADAV